MLGQSVMVVTENTICLDLAQENSIEVGSWQIVIHAHKSQLNFESAATGFTPRV
jgi:hypothetical protein